MRGRWKEKNKESKGNVEMKITESKDKGEKEKELTLGLVPGQSGPKVPPVHPPVPTPVSPAAIMMLTPRTPTA